MQFVQAEMARDKVRSIPFEYASELQFMRKSQGVPRDVQLLQQHDLFVDGFSLAIGLLASSDELPGIGICRHPGATFLILFLCERTFATFGISNLSLVINKWSRLPRASWMERFKGLFTGRRDKREVLRLLAATGEFTQELVTKLEKAPVSFTTFLPGDVLVIFPYDQYENPYDLKDCLWKAGITKVFHRHIHLHRGSFDAEWFERVYARIRK